MAAITTQEELARDATGAGARMTKAVLKQCCVDNEGYESPELNDNLYLHFKGFRKIENLEEYTELKGLWLEANGLRCIENINHLSKLRCIFLSRNLIETIPPTAFRGVSSLVMLDLSENRLTKLEHLADSCPNLETLNVNKNALPDAESIKELALLPNLKNLQIERNELKGEDIIQALAAPPQLCGINAAGNPCVREIPQWRKKCLCVMPLLAYLDRPVFENEREAALAWQEGGHEAELKCKQDFAQRKKDKDKQSMARYRQWQKEVRAQHLERKAMATDDSVGARLDREAREQRRDTEESLRIEARAQAEADAAQIQSGKILSADKPADHRPFLPKNHPEYIEESSDDEDAYLKQAYGITDDLPPPPPVEKKKPKPSKFTPTPPPPPPEDVVEVVEEDPVQEALKAVKEVVKDAANEAKENNLPNEQVDRVQESLYLYKKQKEAKKAGRLARERAKVTKPAPQQKVWTEAMDTQLSALVRETCFDFEEVAKGLGETAEACRNRWSALDGIVEEGPQDFGGLRGPVAGVSVRRGDAPGEVYKGDRIPTFDELKRRAAALPPRFTVDPSSLPSVGDVSDDDGDEVAVFSKTDFDTLE